MSLLKEEWGAKTSDHAISTVGICCSLTILHSLTQWLGWFVSCLGGYVELNLKLETARRLTDVTLGLEIKILREGVS